MRRFKTSLVADSWKYRKKRKTYAEALKEDFRNGMKETKEGEVSDGERNIRIRDNVSYVNKVIDCNKESGEFGKPKPNFSKVYKGLLFSEQINSSGMSLTLPIQKYPLLITLAIAVLQVHVHLEICHWIHMIRKFLRNFKHS